jgi:hypothetical protein
LSSKTAPAAIVAGMEGGSQGTASSRVDVEQQQQRSASSVAEQLYEQQQLTAHHLAGDSRQDTPQQQAWHDAEQQKRTALVLLLFNLVLLTIKVVYQSTHRMPFWLWHPEFSRVGVMLLLHLSTTQPEQHRLALVPARSLSPASRPSPLWLHCRF